MDQERAIKRRRRTLDELNGDLDHDYVCGKCKSAGRVPWSWGNIRERNRHEKVFHKNRYVSTDRPFCDYPSEESTKRFNKACQVLHVLRVAGKPVEFFNMINSLISAFKTQIGSKMKLTNEMSIFFKEFDHKKSVLFSNDVCNNAEGNALKSARDEIARLCAELRQKELQMQNVMEENVRLGRLMASLSCALNKNIFHEKEMEAEMLALNETNQFYQVLVKNLHDLIRDFKTKAPNSPLRRSIIALLMKNIGNKKRFIQNVIIPSGLHGNYAYNITDGVDQEILYEIKYTLKPNYPETRFPKEVIDLFKDIIDVVLPEQSGKKFRIRSMPKEDVWWKYSEIALDRHPELDYLGYSSFWKHFEKDIENHKLHFVKVMKHCPVCNAFHAQKEGKILDPVEQKLIRDNPDHKQEIRDAYGHMTKKKKELFDEKREKDLVAVQDYTQYHVGGAFYQVLIIVFYWYDPEKPVLLHHFFQFFREGDLRNSNDKFFTWGVWSELFHKNLCFDDDIDDIGKCKHIRDFENFYIFSDGAGKHFKNRFTHLYYYCMQKKWSQYIKKWDYNYLKSNHANNVADTGSSHGKQQVRLWEQRNQRIAISSEYQASSIVDTRKNHSSKVVSIHSLFTLPFESDVTVYDTMRKNHRLINDHDNQRILTYARSFDKDEDKEPKEIVELTNTEIQEMDDFVADQINAMDGVTDLSSFNHNLVSEVLPYGKEGDGEKRRRQQREANYVDTKCFSCGNNFGDGEVIVKCAKCSKNIHRNRPEGPSGFTGSRCGRMVNEEDFRCMSCYREIFVEQMEKKLGEGLKK